MSGFLIVKLNSSNLKRSSVIIVLICFSFSLIAQTSDSANSKLNIWRYIIKISLREHASIVVSKLEDKSSYDNSYTFGINSTKNSDNYNRTNSSVVSLGHEAAVDFYVPKKFKVCLALNYNKYHFKTGLISAHEETSHYVGNPNASPPTTTVTSYFTGTDTYYDEIDINFLSFYNGIGFVKQYNRFYYEMDAGIKYLFGMKGELKRTYTESYPSSIIWKQSENLELNKDNRFGPYSGAIVIHAGGGVNLIPHVSLSFGINYNYIVGSLKHVPWYQRGENNIYITFRYFNQFSLYGGLTFSLR